VIEVSLVGSTGSIGTQAIEVVEAEPDRFRIVALAANRSVDLLVAQAKRVRPDLVAIGDVAGARAVSAALPGTRVVAGEDGLREAAAHGDVVVNGVVGFAGLPVTLAALEHGKRLALANKESLIAGGPVVQRARRASGGEIVPVDSEHCAIHQCLRAVDDVDDISRLLVTASGGPFRGWTVAQLGAVTVEEALAHPTWSMGPKITVDSSTLMNKGLEVIEAHELFGVPYHHIDVVVHPQSLVHSMVELRDGTTLAQLSRPDMRLPIGYAMGWPDRLGTPFGPIDWRVPFTLGFEAPDTEAFRCLGLAFEAGRRGGDAPAWLNAANEVAVAGFLGRRLRWLDIPVVVAEVLDACPGEDLGSAAAVVAADTEARQVAGRVADRLAEAA